MRAVASELSVWLPYRRVQNEPEVRLFCFAHAGGAASVYRDWADRLPPSIEVCALQLPGREARLMEKPFTRMEALVDALVPVIAPLLDRPFGLFGYSMGAAIAWETARRIGKTLGSSPDHLFLCARRASHLPSLQPPIHLLAEPEFKQKLRTLGGTPEEALNNAELLELILPTLRADFELNDTHVSRPEALPSPITVFGGDQDVEVTQEALELWRELTNGPFSRRMLPGGHFFLRPNLGTILTEVEQKLIGVKPARD